MAAITGASAWRLPAGPALAWAAVLGVAMSTQYFFQPFVWRHWPIDEVLLGWVDVLRDRVIVALTIGLALVGAGMLPVQHIGGRALLVGLGVTLGAVAGEGLLMQFGLPDAASDLAALAGRAARWIITGCCVAGMFLLWRRGVETRVSLQRAELRAAELERQRAETRLLALRSQIEPHFLFNTLATVRRLHHTDAAQGAALLGDFVAYLRLSLPSQQTNRSTLGAEVDMVQAYLRIVALRMSGRLAVRIDVPPHLRGDEVPPLALATLVENAVKHGIGPCPEGGTIDVRARDDGGVLDITVADTGAGFAASGGSGIGLANIRARLATLHGEAASLSLHQHEPRGVCARLRIPRLAGSA